MKLQLFRLTVVAVLSGVPFCILAQQPSPKLSDPLRTTYYPEALCVGCILPEWDHGLLLEKEIHKDPSIVSMYDSTGRKLLAAHISPPEYSDIGVHTAASTKKGGVIAAAVGNATDGNRHDFIAKTDSAGRTVQSLRTEGFAAEVLCEADDFSVWALGVDWDADEIVVQRYSFEKGLTARFVAVEEPAENIDTGLKPWQFEIGYLHCGKDRVSVFLPRSRRYVEIDIASGNLTRWKVDISSAIGPSPAGFAVTDDGRTFAAFVNSGRSRLYELRAPNGSPLASLVPITAANGTDAEQFAVGRLWSAEGNELIVARTGDGLSASWVKVISTPSNPD